MKRKILLFLTVVIFVSLFLINGVIRPGVFTQHALIIELPLYFFLSISLFLWVKKSHNLKSLSIKIIGSILISLGVYMLMGFVLTSCYFPKSLLNVHKTLIKFEVDEHNQTKAIFKESEHPVQWCF